MVTLLTWPMTSVNCRSTNSILSSFARRRISSLLGLSPRICFCSFELPIGSATAATIDGTFLPLDSSRPPRPEISGGIHRPPSEPV